MINADFNILALPNTSSALASRACAITKAASHRGVDIPDPSGQAGCIVRPPLLVARQPINGRPFGPPCFSHGATYPFEKDPHRVESSGGIQASLGGRYATALFQLARESKAIDAVEASLATIKAALSESADFRALAMSPLVSRANAEKAIAATAKAMKLDPITTKFLGVLAQNRRLN